MKYIKSFILIFILLFVGIINCYAEKNTTSVNNKRIFDYADLYSSNQEKNLNKKVKEFIDSSKIDPIIVTVDKLEGKTISEYAMDFYKSHKFKSNAVVFVIYINEVEPQIYMYGIGKKAAKCYTDDRIGEILEYVYDYVEKKEYYEATDKYMDIIQGFYDLDQRDSYYLNDEGKIVRYIPWIEIIILSLTIPFILIMLFIYQINSNNKVNKDSILDDKLDKEKLIINTEKDELIDINISK